MVGKNHLKLIKSLHQKKYRNQHQLFVVEGLKAVNELLDADFPCFKVFADNEHIEHFKMYDVQLITIAELRKISALKTPNGVLGVFNMPKPKPIDLNDWMLALDDVRDPGNLGTILRLCDWFGIKHVICSMHTVDCYNPKVVQATMGSLARVNIVYQDLSSFFKQINVPVYGAFMHGEAIYATKMPKQGIIVMGNEANGISQEVAQLINKRISIPPYGDKVTESLNVATATAVMLGELRRQLSHRL